MEERSMRIIARIRGGFSQKFGIPRQSGLVEEVRSRVVFEKEFRDANALSGIEGYSHLWLIWEFSENLGRDWSPMVRPPRLGGNTRVGVFATRSPFRPNPVGLSCVRLLGMEKTRTEGTVLWVAGADLLDGTPIYDIKPYLAYTDSRPDASGGFSDGVRDKKLSVIFPKELFALLPGEQRAAVCKILEGDPRPWYQEEPERIYGMEYGGFDIRFRVQEGKLTVCSVEKKE